MTGTPGTSIALSIACQSSRRLTPIQMTDFLSGENNVEPMTLGGKSYGHFAGSFRQSSYFGGSRGVGEDDDCVVGDTVWGRMLVRVSRIYMPTYKSKSWKSMAVCWD